MTELVGQGKPFHSAVDKAAGMLKRKVGTGAEFMKELMGVTGIKPTELQERGLTEIMGMPRMTHDQFMANLATRPAPAIHEKVLGEKPALPSKEVLRRNANDLIRVRAREYASEGTDTSAEYRRLAAEEMQRLRSNHMDQALRLAEERATENPSSTYHKGYTLPGGENYREMLIKAPKKPDYRGQIEAAHRELRSMPYSKRTPEQEERVGQLARLMRELEAKEKELPEQFPGVGGHFGGEPGILASMRLKDRLGPNGEKLLHLEELQSDWHQQGREKGYDTPERRMEKETALNNLLAERSRLLDEQQRLEELAKPFTSMGKDAPANIIDQWSIVSNRLQNLQTEQNKLGRTFNEGVPDAPFKKNWEEMAIKRLIHHAAEKGYHGIVMTPGQEQADRYSLSKHVGAVSYNPEEKHFQAFKPNRETVLNEKGVTPERIAELIGKEASEKLMSAPQTMGHHYLEGENLDVGSQGMKGFYDKKVPNIFNAVGKKHGVKMQLHGHTIEKEPANRLQVGEMTYEDPAKLAQLHHFPITEPMRQDVLKNGLPLYNTGGVIHKAEGGNVQPSVEQMRMALQNKGTFPKYGIQSIGANEAPSMSPKYYIEPGNDGHPSVGGVDMNTLKPGMQLVQQDAQAMQPPQGTPQGAPQGGNNSSPLGAPPSPQGGQSNILSMTPQGQALGAMTTQQPPNPMGMASGGSMHYAPSRPLSQSEISDMAERMVRQSKGLEMPSTTTKQQFEREKNLPIDIRKSGKEIQQPIIDYSQHLGASSVGVPGDPSRGGLVPSTNKKGFPVAKAGETLRGIGGQKLESPVGLFGGYKYGAYGHPMAWASDLGSSAGMFNVVKKLAEENPDAEILGHYHKMTPESLHHAVHMLHTVLSHHQPHNLNDEHIALLDHLMKKVAITKGKNDIPYPEFPGFKKPEEVMLHGSLKSGMRKKIIKLLGTEKYFPGGKQKMDDIMYAISHPELRNMETGSGGSAIIRFDPTVDLKSTQSLHPTYGHDIPSKLIGRTRYITPAHILAPRSMANAEREIKAMGKKVVPFNQAKMNIIREPIDEQYVNQMGEYEHEMKKRLGYKKGGKVANMDTMRLELSKKTKKA